ncbi:MAG: hypothetical protein MUD14_28110 [Hydrococcus sp. Prado102]|jgi:hypothetical protein|nr:hypothetical protein [Hydrococcus sp. Prado102]
MSNSRSPKAWSRLISLTRESNSIVPEVLVGNFGQLAKWSARFRLAKSFKALDLGNAYSGSDTPRLYSAITRIFLVYSAFEIYCYIIGLNPSNESQIKLLQDSYSQQEIIKIIRDLDTENALPTFLAQHLTNRHLKQMMCDFREGRDVNVSCFARCIRHVFAHGILTANSTGLSPKRFDRVSQIISDFLLNCMDEDFDKRVP